MNPETLFGLASGIAPPLAGPADCILDGERTVRPLSRFPSWHHLREMPVAAIAALLGEYGTRLWRVIPHHAEQARPHLIAGKLKFALPHETARNPVFTSWCAMTHGMAVENVMASDEGFGGFSGGREERSLPNRFDTKN